MGFLNTARLVAAGILAGATSAPALAQVASPGVYDLSFFQGPTPYTAGHTGTAALWVGEGGVVNYATGTIDGLPIGLGTLGGTMKGAYDPTNGSYNFLNPVGNDNVVLAGSQLGYRGLDLVTRPDGNTFNLFNQPYDGLIVSAERAQFIPEFELTSFSITQRPGTVYDFSFLYPGDQTNLSTYDGSGRFLVNDGLITDAYGTLNGQELTLAPLGSGVAGLRSDNQFNSTSPYFSSGGVAFTFWNDDPALFGSNDVLSLFSSQGTNRLATLSGNVYSSEAELSTLRVTQVGAAVPEPTTWALMLVGFGAVGFSMRRRRAGSFLPQAA